MKLIELEKKMINIFKASMDNKCYNYIFLDKIIGLGRSLDDIEVELLLHTVSELQKMFSSSRY